MIFLLLDIPRAAQRFASGFPLVVAPAWQLCLQAFLRSAKLNSITQADLVSAGTPRHTYAIFEPLVLDARVTFMRPVDAI